MTLGKINMIPKSRLLAEVIIKSGSPIRIKGETTVYTADSYKLSEVGAAGIVKYVFVKYLFINSGVSFTGRF